MARIAVIGMSSFGYYLAKNLGELGSEVLAVDRDEAQIERIKAYVSKAVVADASDRTTLRQLGLEGMDAVVLSMGARLEASIIAAMHLKEIGVKRVVAKALSEDHAKILELIGVEKVVFPERDMGIRIASSLHGTNVMDYLPLGSDLSIVEMIPRKEMIGKTPEEMDFRERYKCQILAVKNTDANGTTFIPHPTTRFKESHRLIVMGKDGDLTKLVSR